MEWNNYCDASAALDLQAGALLKHDSFIGKKKRRKRGGRGGGGDNMLQGDDSLTF